MLQVLFVLAVMAALGAVVLLRLGFRVVRRADTRDRLTHLPDRTLLDERLAGAMARARVSGRPLAAFIVDLDDFKDLNDSHGHLAGDAVLEEIGRRLATTVRPRDSACRLAGDEFLMLAGGLDEIAEAEGVAAKILAALERPVLVDGRPIEIGASIGISIYPADGGDARTLLRHADLALESAKRDGKRRYRFFAPGIEAAHRRRLAIERGLRGALERHELFLEYQPMVDLELREISGIEALLRWRSPELGDPPPAEFAPIAERTGLILPIGDWVLETACRQVAEWKAAGEPVVPVSCNVSARQLQHEDFPHIVAATLAQTGLDPGLLVLELTESVALRDVRQSQRIVSKLIQLGVRIVIDDFGAGHSSLTRLRRLPLQAVKIDRTFIRNITRCRKDVALVAGIVAMARQLEVRVIAEGVETPDQLEVLQSIGIPGGFGADRGQLQGFIFSPPVGHEEVPALLRRSAARPTSITGYRARRRAQTRRRPTGSPGSAASDPHGSDTAGRGSG